MSLDNDYAQEREAQRRQAEGKLKTAENALKQEYQKPEAQAVIADILRELDEQYTSAFVGMATSVDNSTKQSSYGQRAFICDMLRSYIRDKLS